MIRFIKGEAALNVYMEDNFCTVYKLKFHQLQKFLESHHFNFVDRPQGADIVISGLCAAFTADEARSVAIMKSNATHGVPHYAIGCLVSVNPSMLIADYAYKTWEFPELAYALTGIDTLNYDNTPLPSKFRCKNDYRIYDETCRFVGVTTGCGFKCSYCPHLLGAGSVKSRTMNAIIRDIKMAIDDGATTIHLTGIDTASYGQEINIHFGALLSSILENVGNEAVYHIAQFNPEGLNVGKYFETLVRACSDNRVVSIQLPIQTASNRLLKLMNRNYSISTVRDFVQRLKSVNPRIFLRTDLMIGFPTETNIDIDNTIQFAGDLFNEVAVYIYERKEGTPSSLMPSESEIKENEKKRRHSFVTEKLSSKGIIVHSGGQILSSLIAADKKKHTKVFSAMESSRQ